MSLWWGLTADESALIVADAMKIVCQSCATNYRIADDKIQGKKVFKIKCKKCGEDILVRGLDAPAAGPSQTISDGGGPDAIWHMVINGDQSGPFTVDQLRGLLADGSIDAETYGWREGFENWRPMSEVAELGELLKKHQNDRKGQAAYVRETQVNGGNRFAPNGHVPELDDLLRTLAGDSKKNGLDSRKHDRQNEPSDTLLSGPNEGAPALPQSIARTGVPDMWKMPGSIFPMRLSGDQVRELRDALVDAFPTWGALAQMVRVRLDYNLAAVASGQAALRDVSYTLITWAEVHGRTEPLLRGAVKENPNNPTLRAFVLSLGGAIDEQGEVVQDRLSLLYAQGASAEVIERVRSERRAAAGYELQPGEHLGDEGRYRLLRKLGRGGFATVWEAQDVTVRCRVAVKVLHADFGSDTTRVERFKRGAYKMLRLGHPGVVQVLREYDLWKGVHYFVMRYLEGGDLKQGVLEGRVKVDEGLRLVAEIGDVLVYAHEHEGRLVHRDVKPENILLTGGPHGALEARLTDFDLARAADSRAHTTAGSAMGTLLFAAPEALKDGASADERADVFSLGCTALFVVLGREFSVQEWVMPAAPLRTALCAEHVKFAIIRAMAQDPAKRFATMRAFVDALRGISSQPANAWWRRVLGQG